VPSKFTERFCTLMLVPVQGQDCAEIDSTRFACSLACLLAAQILGVMSNMVYIVYRASYDVGVLGPSKTAFPLLIVAYLTVPTEFS
jgi:hypothetical protein